MSVSNIGNIHFIAQNQGVATDLHAKAEAKIQADALVQMEVEQNPIINESEKSSSMDANIDEERQNSNQKEEKKQKKGNFFNLCIEDKNSDDEENSQILEPLASPLNEIEKKFSLCCKNSQKKFDKLI